MSLSYTNRDALAIRDELINSIHMFTDKWTDHSESDLGITIIEFIASVGDFLSFYMDRQALETYLDTAVQDKNIRSLLRVMNYRIPLIGSARGFVYLGFELPTVKPYTLPKNTLFTTTTSGVYYASTKDIEIPVGSEYVLVPVIQGEPAEIRITKRDVARTVSGRRWDLETNDVAEGTVEITQSNAIWEECEDALLKYKGGYYYSTHRDSDGNVYILFSVDCLDLFPADENEEIIINFIHSKGLDGVVKQGEITGISSDFNPIRSVGVETGRIYNIADTTGAWSEIDLEKAKTLARVKAQTMDRYITLEDYENGVKTEPYIHDCIIKDWKDSAYVGEPYLIRVWAIDLNGNPIGSEEATKLKEKLESKGVSTVKVQVMQAEIIEFNLSIALILKTTNDTIKDRVVSMVREKLEEYFDSRNVSFGKRISINQIISLVMGVSPYIEDVVIENPTSDIKVSAIQYPKLGQLEINVV